MGDVLLLVLFAVVNNNGDADADAEDVDQRDDVVCTVCDRITCIAPPVGVQVCNTSNCLRWVCWVPLGCEIFWESDIWNEISREEKKEKRRCHMIRIRK